MCGNGMESLWCVCVQDTSGEREPKYILPSQIRDLTLPYGGVSDVTSNHKQD